MNTADWTTMVERGIVMFGELYFICYLQIWIYCIDEYWILVY
jgi:hypothetical protein